MRAAARDTARRGSVRVRPISTPSAAATASAPRPEKTTAPARVCVVSRWNERGLDSSTYPSGASAGPTGSVTVRYVRGSSAWSVSASGGSSSPNEKRLPHGVNCRLA